MLLEEMSKDIKDLKGDGIYDQTAKLTEFKTDVYAKLQRIENGIEVLVKENFNNKIEILELKKKISI